MTKDLMYSAQLAEEYLAQNYLFRKNVLSGKVEYKKTEGNDDYKILTRESMNSITHKAKVEGYECTRTDFEEVIFSEETITYDPIKDYLDTLPAWDGVDRLSPLWNRLGPLNDEYMEFVSIWHRSCVAHWLQIDHLHGNECVPLLIGKQGCKKTTFTKILLPEELHAYCLDHLNLSNKFDKEMALTNNLLVNLDEFDSITTSQQASLKQVLSKSKVNGRPIYGGSQDDKPRYASFTATTNQPRPLYDVTGSRRFICIAIPRDLVIDTETAVEYDQLYAQLKHEVLTEKKPYWFSQDQTKRLQELNVPFLHISDLSEIISACFRHPEESEKVDAMSIKDIMSIVKSEYPDFNINGRSTIQVGILLKGMGFVQKRTHQGRCYNLVPRRAA